MNIPHALSPASERCLEPAPSLGDSNIESCHILQPFLVVNQWPSQSHAPPLCECLPDPPCFSREPRTGTDEMHEESGRPRMGL